MPKFFAKRKALDRASSTTSAALDKVLTEASTLIDAGRTAEACQLLEKNLQQFGSSARLRAALATVYGESGRHQDAAVQARIALELAPGRPEYQLLAAIAYQAAGYLAFAHQAREKWLALSPHGPMVEEIRQLEADYRAGLEELTADLGEKDLKKIEKATLLLDEATWAMNRQRWEEVLQHCRAASKLLPRWRPPRNNASTALYFLGRVREAMTEAEAVLRDFPDDVHALGNLVRYYLAMGKEEAAEACGDKLATLPTPSGEEEAIHLAKRAEAAILLERDAKVDRLLRELKNRKKELPPHLYLYWGIAAANLGRRKEALTHLQRAKDLGVTGPLLNETLAALKRNLPGRGIANRYSYTHFTEWIEPVVFVRIAELAAQEDRTGRPDQRAWAELTDRYPQLPMVLRKLLYEEAETGLAPAAVIDALRRIGTPKAVEIIREFALGTQGSDEQRMSALLTLREMGALPDNSTVEMWIRGQRLPTKTMTKEIVAERADYPDAAWQAYEKAIEAYRAGRADEAERLFRQMLEIAPNAKEAYNNLAAIYANRNDWATVEMYLDKALTLDPLYVFPRTTRALRALNQGDIAGAKAWLEPLLEVKRWHPDAMAVYQKTLARIAIAEEDYETAHNYLTSAMQFVEDDSEIEALLEHVEILQAFAKSSEWFAEHDQRYRRRREAARLPSDPTLADCLSLLTKEDMVGIGRVLGLSGSLTALKKAELYEKLAKSLQDDLLLRDVVDDLAQRERDALRALLDRNGVMTRDEFVAIFGAETERPYLIYHGETATSVPGRLRARGLVYIATVEDRVAVVIPRELRAKLTRLI